ncbi:hypothetical protein FGIG_12666 [Fasciola gigantica]|uniref:Uncharacterized protein n=1 Tax=Fasciola gigantica TaxID=46835 RepID=A0A504Z1M5_FASGI|nr:hypothetical protein FGIG_12666 [Fasciola gigantica]
MGPHIDTSVICGETSAIAVRVIHDVVVRHSTIIEQMMTLLSNTLMSAECWSSTFVVDTFIKTSFS